MGHGCRCQRNKSRNLLLLKGLSHMHALCFGDHLHIQNPLWGGDFGYQIGLNFVSENRTKISGWRGKLYETMMFSPQKETTYLCLLEQLLQRCSGLPKLEIYLCWRSPAQPEGISLVQELLLGLWYFMAFIISKVRLDGHNSPFQPPDL